MQTGTSTVSDDYSYLTVVSGPRLGTNFMLDPKRINRVGRGSQCEILLADRVCSRIHAELKRNEQGWWLLDNDSRNGSYVDDQRVSRTLLADGAKLRFGSSEFIFHQSDDPPTRTAAHFERNQPTVVKEAALQPGDSSEILLHALENAEFAHDLLVVYQLSVKLVGAREPDEVAEVSLQLLHERTKAAVVGFLWLDDQGQLQPKHVVPRSDAPITLSQSLTDIVSKQGRAVWVSSSKNNDAERPRPYSDAICIPLIHQEAIIGALHLYLKQGRFRQTDFDFAISVANLMAVAFVRTRQDVALSADRARLARQAGDVDALIGQSPAMRELKSNLARIALATGTVLICGESGTGKELVARALHQASTRADRPLLSVNCAALPEDLIESQLFGHVKGAFTHAESNHAGWFQRADTGTLFLDEIGDLPLPAQAKLLRVIEGHSFSPVGATEEKSVDARLFAATSRNLKQLVADKRFREDLYYRLSVFVLDVPALRQRDEDLELLVDHFLNHFRMVHGRPKVRLHADARKRLLTYQWPGNVRQLRNVIDSAVVLAKKDVITENDLGLYQIDPQPMNSLRIADWEKKLIEEALGRSRGKVEAAATLLGISRATLYRKLDEYDIRRS